MPGRWCLSPSPTVGDRAIPRSDTGPGRSLLRRVGFSLVAVLAGTFVALLAAEVACRLLPVATGSMAVAVHAGDPIFRFTPDRDYLWSTGWNFATVNRGRVNNAGFVNDQDYREEGAGPLLAVVGDSYVEALMVPYAQTLHGRLQRCVGATGRVYSFAASGAPLSQYLIWAQHARRRYDADGLVFVVVGNDFDESLAKYKQGPGFHHFVETPDGTLALRLVDYSPSSLRALVRGSALARYLVFNLHAEAHLGRLFKRVLSGARADAGGPFVGNTSSSAGRTRVADSERAIDAFLEQLPQRTGLAPERILFVLDGIRPQLYRGAEALGAVRGRYYPRMRRYFAHRARLRGHEVVDLQPLFMSRYLREREAFEFEHDAHWNGRGHEVAARAVLDSAVFRAVFPDTRAAATDCPAAVR